MSASVLLAVEGLDVAYGRARVLESVDLAVCHGEAIALLGTNGAGKSTLLRTISGLLRPTRGRIVVDGMDLTARRPLDIVRAGVVHMAGGRATFPGLTVEENLRIGSTVVPVPEREARAAIVLEQFPWIAGRRRQLAGSLSGGEQQMLALARALMSRPRVLLVDELSLGLAPAVVADLLVVLDRLRREGTAVVLVDQQVDLALAFADRAYFLERGVVRFEGPAEDLRARTDLLRAVFLTGASPGGARPAMS